MQSKRDERALDVPTLDVHDEVAALDAIRVALSQVPDGSAYVWHRRHGRMSGIVQPTVSFKDTSGRVCRHIVVTMTRPAISWPMRKALPAGWPMGAGARRP